MPKLTPGTIKVLQQMGQEAREAILEALAQGKRLLTHYSESPDNLMSKGIDFSKLETQGEPYKPAGLYWGQTPEDVSRLTATGDVGDSEPNWRNFILGTTDPNQVLDPVIDDIVLHNRMLRALPETQNLHVPTRLAAEISPQVLDMKKSLTSTLANRGPIVELNDVDDIKGMRELIQMKPGVVNAYWRDKARLLSLGGLGATETIRRQHIGED